jgi:hypothetical protein
MFGCPELLGCCGEGELFDDGVLVLGTGGGTTFFFCHGQRIVCSYA